MRIVLLGQAAFGEKTLDKLENMGEEVLAVFCPPDVPGGKIDPLKQKALQLGIPVHQPLTYKRPEVQEHFRSLQSDLGILAFVSHIVPQPVFSAPRLGSICFHPSLLPKYRGASAINWALINGETRTGLTVFWVDKGIDTGPVLLQKEVKVEPDDTTGSLYFNKIFPEGVDAIGEAVELIKSGNPPRVVQDESKATYDPPCGDEHAKIDWAKPAQQVYNLIRGCDPQPGAHTIWAKKRVRIFDARFKAGEVNAVPGEIIAVGSETLDVALAGGILNVKRMRSEGGKISAAEFANHSSLKVGDRFG
ncbi:MAG: methionyl-tRNA formyltransferase [Deltaproteobacteria bacterium]|nr:methionyl-tRNA formyltransferase [Deltaproteobacteria bacterium]